MALFKSKRTIGAWKCNLNRFAMSHNSTVKKIAPLDGIRILDLTRIVAGPFCTMILGDLGADVIKLENPKGGDECRKWGPPFKGGESCYFFPVNRNKRSVCVNLRSKQGISVVHDLVKYSDVLMENYVPGKLASLGLGYDQLKILNPRLIYTSLTGYGPDGRYSSRPGYDVIAASEGGLLGITGPQGGAPCKIGVAMTDLATGLYAHGAILAALHQRSQTGLGQKIDVNLLSTQISCLINIASNYLNAGYEAKRLGTSHASIVPYQSFETAEGEYITICCGSDEQFADLCQRLDLTHISEDLLYKTNSLRVTNRNSLVKILEDKFVSKDSLYWLHALEGGSSPYGKVNSLQQVFDDPHVKDIGLVQTVQHPTAGEVHLVGPPVTYSVASNTIHMPPPTLGQHTNEVLTTVLGYSHTYDEPTLRLRLKKPKSQKKVQFDAQTVDNEHLNKKKSKCCCIYKKPHKFGESSSESEDECDNCFGHKDKNSHKHEAAPNSSETNSLNGGGTQ